MTALGSRTVALSALAASLLVASIVMGCGGDGDDQGSTQPTTTTTSRAPTAERARTTGQPEQGSNGRPRKRSTKKEKKRETPASGGTTGTGQQQQVPETNSAKVLSLKRYLRETFGKKANWYEHIDAVSVSGSTTTVDTDLEADRAGRRLADEICLEIIGSIPGITDVVRIRSGPDRRTLARCVP
jgi:hypothetical protein